MSTNFHDLYQRYAQDVYRFAYWLCGEAAEAEDITSETFIRALTAAGALEAETVKGYLLTIARNLVFKRSKAKRRRTGLEEDLPDPRPGPAQKTEARQEMEAVWRLLSSLAEVDRSALLLRAQEGLPYEEIARILSISVPAAKVKVHRARLKLIAARARIEEAE